MKNKFRYVSLLLLLALLLVPASSVYAQGNGPGDGSGRVIFGTNFTLKSGDTFEGDLVLFGGNVTIEEGATLKGNLVVIGGQVKSNGKLDGDLVVVGGQVNLEKTAVVEGDVVTVGGQLQQEEGAKIKGEVVNNVAPQIDIPNGRVPPVIPGVPSVPAVPSPNINFNFSPFANMFMTLLVAVAGASFAMLLTLFWEPQIQRVGNILVTQPVMVGAVGLLAIVAGIILALTIVPPVIVACAWLFGIVALGSEIGERLSEAVSKPWSSVLATGLGTFLLLLVGGSLGLIPCFGGLIQFVIGLMGIGATLISWFGTRPVQSPAINTYNPPASQSQIPPTS
jgi:hypothetical protein